ncbi:CNH domain-containing protein [Irpex rosettiformis]|uniref:CNH domain-containing protein n=1 Tax=Irpex rosettiformis TaxID=378272 RepID=A0ACB8UAZ4_9APHY|nr:CNH domain-containing protein [Irpex rosettiformis]
MERPLGPRAQPDKRNAAYESIFGRPSASHHHPSSQTSYDPYAQSPYQYPATNNEQHSGSLGRRTSFTSTTAPSISHAPSPPVPSAYTQQYCPPQQQPYPPGAPTANYARSSTQSLRPPSTTSRARSVGRSTGVIIPLPEEPPDPKLESLTRAGLTPAQAYQAQVYANNPSYQNQTHPDDRQYLLAESPRIGLNIESEDGRLGLDFGNTDVDAEGTHYETYSQQSAGNAPYSQSNNVRSRLSPASTFAPIAEQPVASSSTSPYPLQLNTAVNAAFAPISNSPGSSTLVDPSPTTSSYTTTPSTGHPSGRRSSESSRTLPGPGNRREKISQDRSRSMSATIPQQMRVMLEGGRRPPNPSPKSSAWRESGDSTPPKRKKRMPVIYPALLSLVGQALKDSIVLGDLVKDGLTYKDAFTGREAVDKIASIIKTTDRNLALLLGRALDAQKFFHAVTYDHRLRDTLTDLYQFPTKLPSPFVSGELAYLDGNGSTDVIVKAPADPLMHSGLDRQATVLVKQSRGGSTESGLENGQRDGSPSPPDSLKSPEGRPRRGSITSDEVLLPSGVFTLLTDCYSPTCSRDRLCYSIACPRRLEQQTRLNMKLQPGLKKQISKESLGEMIEPGTLWIHSVPQAVVDSVSDQEKKRQEAINEVIYTERDFVRDMEYLRDLWMKPLRESDIIPESRRQDFLEQVFWNIQDIIAVNIKLRDALNKRQKSFAVVEQIGDILLDAVPNFGPFVSYGAHQLYGKFEFEKEKSSNQAFARFVEEVERRPESRKLELNGYLTKPTTRLARYPLLLEAVLKHTPDDNPDKTALPKAVEIVREFLKAVNAETGKAENRFNLLQLDQQLVFRAGEQVDLRLREEGRELVYKGPLKKRGGGQGDSAELLVFLFDHALLMVKQKTKTEQYKVYRRPIPLELLLVSAPDDDPSSALKSTSRSKAMLSKNSPHAPVIPIKEAKGGYSITFVHLGRKYYQMTLWASTYVSQRKWVEHITRQQDLMRDRSQFFETVTLSEGFFNGSNRVNCAAPFSQGRRAVYGTFDGVYISNLWEPHREPMKVLALADVTQVDVLEEYQLLIVLAEGVVVTFPLDALDPRDPTSGVKRAKRIASHISFFKAGICLGKTLVCVVKASGLSSTIKALEPIDTQTRGKNKPTFKKILQGGNDTLRPVKEFYIPVQSSSIHFLKTRLCIGCTNGFEIVDLETLDTQGLLDPADASLDFVRKKEGLRPMAIFRIENEFLLCYDEFAFYVNKTGWRSRKQFMICWEGSPTGFALHYPYILAFEPTFVEIRSVLTSSISQIIQGNNLRLLFADTPPSTTNSQFYGSYQQSYSGYNQYGSPPVNGYGGRASLQNGHGSPYPNPYQPRPPSTGRDEIIMVSDDRIMRVQPRV